MVTAEREIMLNLTTQYKLSILQGLVVEQPIQFCSLRRGVAVFVLYGDAVDGKDILSYQKSVSATVNG